MGFTAALTSIGSFVSAGIASGTAAAMIGGAVVGAVVGGLTNLVMGGDIMQGVLFGAIGGAVTGGIASWAGGGTGAVSTAASSTPVTSPMGWESVVAAGGEVAGSSGGATTAAISSTSGALEVMGAGLVQEFGGDFVKGVAGAWMKGEEMDKTQENRLKELQVSSDLRMKEATHNAELANQYGTGSSSGGADHSLEIAKIQSADRGKALMEDARQFNLQREERQQGRQDIIDLRDERRSLFKDGGARGAQADPLVGEGKGVFQARQEEGLAATPGGQAVTKPEVEQPKTALEV